MQDELETDYLVVGAGAAGMAFTDALLTRSNATITIVDRRHAPGGHWVDAYPHVRLHQPSTFYGVDSVPLGQDAIDTVGTNAGFYELAGRDELCAYFDRVMHRHFLPTGRVRWLPSSEYVGERSLVSRLTGVTREVHVRRKVVDTTYLEGTIPATSPPPFEVEPGVRCVPAGEVGRLDRVPERYAILGGGKTSLDTVVWLLESGVPADAILWVRPRDAWWLNRRFQQPLTLFPDLYEGSSLQVQAFAEATSLEALLARLESEGIFLRIDRAVTPTMLHGAIVSEAELALLRTVERVVRLSHVRRIGASEIELDGGRIPTDARTVHVHCAARGLARPPLRPIFEPDRITIQPVLWGFACYQFAMIGVIEALGGSDEEKNRLATPIPYWDRNADYARAFLASFAGDRARA